MDLPPHSSIALCMRVDIALKMLKMLNEFVSLSIKQSQGGLGQASARWQGVNRVMNEHPPTISSGSSHSPTHSHRLLAHVIG